MAERPNSRSTRPLLAIGAVFAAVAHAGCGGEGTFPAVVVADSAGVVLIENTGADAPLDATAVRIAELHAPDSAVTAVPWGVAVDPGSGRIHVLDWTGERVAVFAADGSFEGWIGREGEGPGEFRSPTALALDPHGALQVLDAGRGIVSRWSSTGQLLNEQRAPGAYWGPGFAATRDGWLYVASSESGMEQRQVLVREVAGDTTGLYALPRSLVMMDLPCVRQPASRVFAPSIVWASRGDSIYVLVGDAYRIDLLVDGAVAASYRRPPGPIPVTREMAEARVDMGPYAGLKRMCGVTSAQVVAAIGHRERVSPVLWLAADPAGGLWVARTGDGIRPSGVDLLSPEGGYLGALDLPAIPVAFLSDSAFVAVSVSELDEVRLSLYELRRGAGHVSGGGPAGGGTASPSPPAAERALRTGEFRDCRECPAMVELPSGRFFMGRPPGEAPASADPTRPLWTEEAESPRVAVRIAAPFAIGKYEVTFHEWDSCVAAGGCTRDPDDEGFGRGDRPVIHVRRSDAQEYVTWLRRRTGESYRLPTEAEWEYAARAGTGTAWWWGDALDSGRVSCDGCGSRWDDRSTAPVGSLPPNPFGLHDMLGNVTEWVADCWHEDHTGRPADGSARIETSPWWKDGECERPVRKGGAWSYYPWTTRAAHRSYWRPRPVPPPWPDHSRAGGFRVARSLTPAADDGSRESRGR